MGRKRQRKEGQTAPGESENHIDNPAMEDNMPEEAVEVMAETEAPVSSNIIVAKGEKMVLEREEKSISEGTKEISNLFSSLNLSENTRKSIEKLGIKTMTQVRLSDSWN